MDSHRSRRLQVVRPLATLVVLASFVGCGDKAAPTAGRDTAESVFSAFLDPDCFGGTCQQVGPFINGMPNPLWVSAAAESSRLSGIDDPVCSLMGDALGDLLSRGGLFVRMEGPAPGGAAGHFDPFSGGDYHLPVAGQGYITTGEMWIAPGDYTNAEDQGPMNTVDLVRHEIAHSLIDWDADPFSGNAIIMDAGMGSTFTAQEATRRCA